MSDTPRTDEIGDKWDEGLGMPSEILCLCRELERENAALRAALDQQANYQRDLRADRDRLDWVLSHDGGWWAYWLLKYGPWEHDKDELRKQIDAKLEKEAQP